MLRLVSLGAGTLAALAAGEALTILFATKVLPGPNRDMRIDPALGWVQRPGASSVGANEHGHTVEVRGSPLGIRQPSRGFRAAGDANVMVVGDSLTAGTQVRFEQTWPALPDARWAGRSIQVVNAAVDGYGLVQEYGLAERLWSRFRPCLVVVPCTSGTTSWTTIGMPSCPHSGNHQDCGSC
jgi:hypothetical protein